jgi:hypothetical protein
MAKDSNKPPFYFSNIMTDQVLQGLPGAKERLVRRRSFVARFLRRTLRRSPRGQTDPAMRIAAVETLEKATEMWLTASRGYEDERIDSVIRYIAGLRAPIEANLMERDDPDTVAKVRKLLRRAWLDVKRELARRFERIDDALRHADPERSPDSFYWIEASATPADRRWDDESFVLLAQEVRDVYAGLTLARADLKFLALYADDLRWLVDHGASTSETLSFVPSNRALKAKLRKADQLKAHLNGHVQRILSSSMGSRVRAELERRQS